MSLIVSALQKANLQSLVVAVDIKVPLIFICKICAILHDNICLEE